jgi:quercetin dioxygenase-like cupin family protein
VKDSPHRTSRRGGKIGHIYPAASNAAALEALAGPPRAQYACRPGDGAQCLSGTSARQENAKETVMSVQAQAKTRKVVHVDIKEANPPERAAHYIDAPNLLWEATKFPGIKIKVLYTDGDGVTTALFKLDPGAIVPLHEHTALEQTYVIEGSLEDHEGKCGPGQFVWRPAGNQHEAVAPNGALLLGFFLKPNRFAYGERFFTEPGER